MTCCLYVGNLPRECTKEDLRTLFETGGYGLETVTLVVDRRTGRTRGFGFVAMASAEDAAAAVESLHGAELGGRVLKLGAAYKEKREVVRRSAGYEDYRYGNRSGGGRRRGSR
jgi:cold-inducible RNA-binding protein